MTIQTQPGSRTINVRMTIDVSYQFCGEDLDDILICLHKRCERVIDDGLLTGETAALVDTWRIEVSTPPTDVEIATQEAEIAAFLQQQIEDGCIDAESMALRLTHYGLMTSLSFTSEMHESMRLHDSNSSENGTRLTAPAKGHGEITMQIAVACVNASGIADMPVFIVNITQEEYDLGVHYDKAKALAVQAQYEAPFICFDAHEHIAIELAAKALALTPQVVTIDVTGGLIHSVRCDAGQVKVVCYDTDDTDESSEAVADWPVGEGGKLVHCWAQTEWALTDPGLKQAR